MNITNKKTFVIEAAGGNATVLEILDQVKSPMWYAEHGKNLIETHSNLKVEQAGFVIPSIGYFMMSGGEFCGNAARSAAMIFSALQSDQNVSFHMSGASGQVNNYVNWHDELKASVKSCFTNLPVETTQVETDMGKATVVDLKGIIHIMIRGNLPEHYEQDHKRLREFLKLTMREAVGVCWYNEIDETDVKINPVVWVRTIDTCFYEGSCGSGSIAASVVSKRSKVVQPTGLKIEVERNQDSISLSSEMRITLAS